MTSLCQFLSHLSYLCPFAATVPSMCAFPCLYFPNLHTASKNCSYSCLFGSLHSATSLWTKLGPNCLQIYPSDDRLWRSCYQVSALWYWRCFGRASLRVPSPWDLVHFVWSLKTSFSHPLLESHCNRLTLYFQKTFHISWYFLKPDQPIYCHYLQKLIFSDFQFCSYCHRNHVRRNDFGLKRVEYRSEFCLVCVHSKISNCQ